MVLISIDIDKEVKNKVRMLGMMHRSIYMRGYQDLVNKQSYEEAIQEQRKKVEKMSTLLNHYIVMCVKLEERIKEVEKENEQLSKLRKSKLRKD